MEGLLSMNVVITGANRGIGLELVKNYVENGDNVTACCRKSSDSLRKLDCQILENIDISSQASLTGLAEKVPFPDIDLLINNAGILRSVTLENMDFDSIKEQFIINSMGPIRVTHGLLPKLRKGSKVVFITSRMGSIADNASGRTYGYRMSKAALNAAAKSLSIDLKPKGILVAVIHPGHVQTEMTGMTGQLTADESARLIALRASEYDMETTGKFMHVNGQELPW